MTDRADAPLRQSMAKLVGEKIRGRILDGKLRPGDRLVEDRLSEELGVSRVPIREALRELSAEGLVRIERNRGASVAEVTPQTVAEMIEVRALLEGLNARLAAQRHDPEIVRQLGEVLTRGNAAAEGGSTAQLIRLNAEFHDLLAEAARNAVLSDVMRGLRERSSLAFGLNGRSRAHEDWAEHAGILAAVIAGDGELAAMLATRHVHNAALAFAQSNAAASEQAAD